MSGSAAPTVEPPFLAPISSIMGEILFIALRVGPALTARGARTVADTLVRRRLLAVPGVSQVIAIGGDRKQYQVRRSTRRDSRSHAITLDDVSSAR